MLSADDPVWEGAGASWLPISVQATAEGFSNRGVWVRGSFSGRIQHGAVAASTHWRWRSPTSWRFFSTRGDRSDEDMGLYALAPGADELDLRPSCENE